MNAITCDERTSALIGDHLGLVKLDEEDRITEFREGSLSKTGTVAELQQRQEALRAATLELIHFIIVRRSDRDPEPIGAIANEMREFADILDDLARAV